MIVVFRIIGAGDSSRDEVVHASDWVPSAPMPHVADAIPVAYWNSNSERQRGIFRVTNVEWEIDLIDLVNPENVRYVITLKPAA